MKAIPYTISEIKGGQVLSTASDLDVRQTKRPEIALSEAKAKETIKDNPGREADF